MEDQCLNYDLIERKNNSPGQPSNHLFQFFWLDFPKHKLEIENIYNLPGRVLTMMTRQGK